MIRSALILLLCAVFASLKSQSVVNVPVYSVYEMVFTGNSYKATDNPVRDIELVTTWVNTTSGRTHRVYGFFDGDGKGSAAGNVFKVRVTPDEQGEWTLLRVQSNDRQLNGKMEGSVIVAIEPESHGFWLVDHGSPGSRWYKRSDGTHQYITGNTMYSFLSEYYNDKPTGGNIREDIINNSKYFRKVRIGITGDRYPNPSSKPFLDETGKPTDDGNFSHRPNPEWFFKRLDLAVQTAMEHDLIADLILNGPDTEESRAVLLAGRNNKDATPILRYIAARYGSYPNVWICLSNEFDIKEPVYTPEQIISFGKTIQSFLPYPTPVSIHSVRHWTGKLNSPLPWFDHVIFQHKLKKLDQSADNTQINYTIGGRGTPVINDELAYEGNGDGWLEEDVIEAFLGAFAGGGYGSTGHKSGEKIGHYFYGNFKPGEHSAADNLAWFRNVIDKNIRFWEMEPEPGCGTDNIFLEMFDSRWRILCCKDQEYVLAGSSPGQGSAMLPEGNWRIVHYDVIAMKESVLADSASGKFDFNLNNSRAQLVHFKKIN